jgi:hypothetical protein
VLEIVFVIWFVVKAGNLAESKGRSKALFRATAFLLWLACEAVGIVVARGRMEAGLVVGPVWFSGLIGALIWWGIASSFKPRLGSTESEETARLEEAHTNCPYCNGRVPLGAKRCPICAGEVAPSFSDESAVESNQIAPDVAQLVDRSRCRRSTLSHLRR